MSQALLPSESRELRSTTLSIPAKLLQGLSEPLANTRVFSQLLIQFYSKQPRRSVPKIMCRYCSRLLKAVPAFSHPPQVLIYDQASLIFRSEVSYLIACIAPHHYLHWNVMG